MLTFDNDDGSQNVSVSWGIELGTRKNIHTVGSSGSVNDPDRVEAQLIEEASIRLNGDEANSVPVQRILNVAMNMGASPLNRQNRRERR